MELHRDRFAQAAGEWRDMTFGERIPYEDMARADKERHQKDLDIATRNLNAALVGSVQEHGACVRVLYVVDEISTCTARPSFSSTLVCVNHGAPVCLCVFVCFEDELQIILRDK